MSVKVKVALLVLVAVSFAAYPFVAAAGEKEGVFTVMRVLVGTAAVPESEGASVLIIPGTVVMLGKSPQEGTSDVLQLMAKLKDAYRLGEVTLAATWAETLAPHEWVTIPATLGDLEISATLLGFNETLVTVGVSIKERGTVVSKPKMTIARGERGIAASRGEGSEAPYFFVSIEPLKPYAKLSTTPPAVMPKLIHRVQPAYPPEARKARIDGVVILEARIGTDGVVHDLKAFRSEPMGLTDAAIEAVKQWRYEPAKDASGKPVEATMNVTISFMLDRSNSEKAKT